MSYYKTNKGILKEEYDDFYDIDSPRECNDFSVFLTFESRNSSPDKSEYKTIEEFVIDLAGNEANEKYKKSIAEGNKYFISRLTKRGYAVLPVYKYEHSSITYEAAEANPFYNDWDSGLVGFIYVTPEVIKKHYNVSIITKNLIDSIKNQLKEEVKYYSDWIKGNVYAYLLYSEDGEEIDSMGGFIGDIETNGVKENFEITEYEYIGENYEWE